MCKMSKNVQKSGRNVQKRSASTASTAFSVRLSDCQTVKGSAGSQVYSQPVRKLWPVSLRSGGARRAGGQGGRRAGGQESRKAGGQATTCLVTRVETNLLGSLKGRRMAGCWVCQEPATLHCEDCGERRSRSEKREQKSVEGAEGISRNIRKLSCPDAGVTACSSSHLRLHQLPCRPFVVRSAAAVAVALAAAVAAPAAGCFSSCTIFSGGALEWAGTWWPLRT